MSDQATAGQSDPGPTRTPAQRERVITRLLNVPRENYILDPLQELLATL